MWLIVGVDKNRMVLILENAGTSSTSGLTANQAGFKAPLFEGAIFPTNEVLTLESLRGKYVLLDLWGTWCPPCIAGIPALKEACESTSRDRFEIVGIAHQSPPASIMKTVKEHGMTWPQLVSGPNNNIVGLYGVGSFPTYVLIDPDGVIMPPETLSEIIQKLRDN